MSPTRQMLGSGWKPGITGRCTVRRPPWTAREALHGGGDQVEALADRLELGGLVEEAVQEAPRRHLADVDPGDGQRRSEGLAGRAEAVVLGVEDQHRAQASRSASAGIAYPSADDSGPPR